MTSGQPAAQDPLDMRALGARIADRLVGEILEGFHAPGARLREIQLSERWEVSRTPIREALRKVEELGLVVGLPHRGFQVAPLEPDLARERFAIAAALECAGVRATPTFAAETLRGLTGCLDRMATAGTPRERLAEDMRWHTTLLSDCPNRRLRSLVEAEQVHIVRYRLACLSRETSGIRSVESQRRISAELGTGRTDRAADLLEQHWRSAQERLPSSFGD